MSKREEIVFIQFLLRVHSLNIQSRIFIKIGQIDKEETIVNVMSAILIGLAQHFCS